MRANNSRLCNNVAAAQVVAAAPLSAPSTSFLPAILQAFSALHRSLAAVFILAPAVAQCAGWGAALSSGGWVLPAQMLADRLKATNAICDGCLVAPESAVWWSSKTLCFAIAVAEVSAWSFAAAAIYIA
jgi:hypothetical protein